MTTPGAPTAVSATDGGHSNAVVSYVAPASDGGAAIDQYQICAYQGSVNTNVCVTTSGYQSPVTVPGLTAGQQYTFKVKAHNASGWGSSSSPMASPITVSDVPGAPATISATAGDAQAVIRWTAPANTGGIPLTGYTLTLTDLTVYGDTTIQINDPAATSYTLTGLTNTHSYAVSLEAVTASGHSSDAIVTFTPTSTSNPVLPGAPGVVMAMDGGSGTAKTTWSAPASDGGAAIDKYQVCAYQGGVNTNICVFSTTVKTDFSDPLIISGLAPGQYTFKAKAHNSVGYGPSSGPSALVTVT